MAFDAGSIVARLKLNTKNFTAGIDRATTKSKGFVKQLGFMRSAVGAIGFGLVTRQLMKFIDEGARLRDMERAFGNIAARVGTSGDAIIAETRKITRALSRREMIQAANTLELLGVGMERLPRLTEIARAAAIGLGKDVGFMLESLATGTARQSRLWLDNLGIIISVEEANRDYARQLGITTQALTDQQKRAAFLNSVLIKGQDIIDKVGPAAQSQAERVATLNTAWTDFTDEIKKSAGVPGIPILEFLGYRLRASREEMTKTLNVWKKLPSVVLQQFLHGGARIEFGAGGTRLISPPSFTEPASFEDSLPTRGVRDAAGRRAQEAAIAAQKAAKAYFDALLRGPTSMDRVGVPLPTGSRGSLYAGATIDQAAPYTPEARGPVGMFGPQLELLPSQFQEATTAAEDFINIISHPLEDAFLSLGDAVSSLFHEMITGSGKAGRAFFSNLMSGLGGYASRVGDVLILTGLGMEALKELQGLKAVAAGIGLKAIAGLFGGIASNNAPGASSAISSPDIREPQQEDFKDRRPIQFIVQGDFMGDREWINNLAQKLRIAQRDQDVEVVFT